MLYIILGYFTKTTSQWLFMVGNESRGALILTTIVLENLVVGRYVRRGVQVEQAFVI